MILNRQFAKKFYSHACGLSCQAFLLQQRASSVRSPAVAHLPGLPISPTLSRPARLSGSARGCSVQLGTGHRM